MDTQTHIDIHKDTHINPIHTHTTHTHTHTQTHTDTHTDKHIHRQNIKNYQKIKK